jgi:single-stranded-DNA-specific exonuclease
LIFPHWSLAPSTDDPTIPLPHAALRSLLVRRGVGAGEAYRRFVAPALDDLHDPSTIHGMGEACARIERAVRDGETILIYGDYDVDGVTSIVLLQTVLRSIGADAAHVVPHRLVDGYGLKTEVLDRVCAEKEVRLVITVDCGITSVDPVRRAIERGIDVIITDHHLPPGTLPDAAAVLNPKQPGCDYPFKELAGVGVAFKLCCELVRRNGRKMSIESLLRVAAIGTVADVAPLVGENRTIAWLGLNALADPRNPGLRTLIRRLGMLGRPLRAVDIGFKIGPRINAAGRLSSAETAIDLFAAADEETAWALCTELERMNAERQAVEREVREEAEKQVAGRRVTGLLGCLVAGQERTPSNSATQQPSNSVTEQPSNQHPRILILAGANWHKGVLGLTAGRLAQKYHRPTLVMSIEGDRCVGSGRSIPTVNLHAQLEAAADLFTHFGGHEFACGFSLETRNLPALRERLERQFASLDESLFRKEARVDAELTLGELNESFVRAHELLQPFGAGNPQPLFLARDVEVIGVRPFAEECCELTLRDRTGTAGAVVWPSVQALAAALPIGSRADVLFHIEPDVYSSTGGKMSLADARNRIEG